MADNEVEEMGYDIYENSQDEFNLYQQQQRPFTGEGTDFDDREDGDGDDEQRLHIREVKHKLHLYDPTHKSYYDENLVGHQRPNLKQRISKFFGAKLDQVKHTFTDSSKVQCRQPGEYWEYGYVGQRKVYIENGNKVTAKHGFGTFKYKDGGIYVGYFDHHLMCGSGVFVDCHGNRYQGNFKDDLMHGYGHYSYVSGDVYRGYFKRGQFHGEGIYLWANGNSYEGPFINGVMGGEGIAEYRYASGSYYKGGYKYGEKSGLGIFCHALGDTYEGGFLEGMMHGEGEYT